MTDPTAARPPDHRIRWYRSDTSAWHAYDSAWQERVWRASDAGGFPLRAMALCGAKRLVRQGVGLWRDQLQPADDGAVCADCRRLAGAAEPKP